LTVKLKAVGGVEVGGGLPYTATQVTAKIGDELQSYLCRLPFLLVG
jgi:hypothetical protein